MEAKNSIIRVKGLTKRYGSLVAVDSLDLEIREGEIFGLLGPNGAGKTTTILMLLGLTEPEKGTAEISGYHCTRDPIRVKRIVGYLPDNVGFYEDMTGRENLRFTGQLNAIDDKTIAERMESLLQRVKLQDVADKKVGTYSRGMKQRLGIADVLMKDPRVVILDEPTLGIDPEGIRELIGLIRDLSVKDGRTVLISSHQLYQVQQICDRVGIFVKGRLIACGPIESLGKQVRGDAAVTMEFKAQPDGEALLALIGGVDGVESVDREKDLFVVRAKKDVRGAIAKEAVQNGYSLTHLMMRGGDLDEIYRRYFAKEGVV